MERENKATGDRILALHNVTDQPQLVDLSAIMEAPCVDLLSELEIHDGDVELDPYGVMWLTPME